MSQEDVRNSAGLLAESRAWPGGSGAPETQGQHQDPETQGQHQDLETQGQDLETQGHGQDGIVLERIASLPLDMFEPSDFTGRFSKIQSRSRKRSRILGGRHRRQTHV